MSWLSQNWIWIVLGVGVIFFMTRMGGCGMGRSMRHNHGSGQDVPPSDTGSSPRMALDPVSKRPIVGGTSISSVYRDRAYYFETRENREAFEAAPEQYLAGTTAMGPTIDDDRPRRHRHGC